MELVIYQVIEELTKKYPNDMELGKKVREYINSLKKDKEKKDGV